MFLFACDDLGGQGRLGWVCTVPTVKTTSPSHPLWIILKSYIHFCGVKGRLTIQGHEHEGFTLELVDEMSVVDGKESGTGFVDHHTVGHQNSSYTYCRFRGFTTDRQN